MGKSTPRPNTPALYNAQPYKREPLSTKPQADLTAKRHKRAARWFRRNPVGATPPRHIARDWRVAG